MSTQEDILSKKIFNAFAHRSDAVKFKDTFKAGTHKVVKSKIFDIDNGKWVPCYTVVRK